MTDALTGDAEQQQSIRPVFPELSGDPLQRSLDSVPNHAFTVVSRGEI